MKFWKYWPSCGLLLGLTLLFSASYLLTADKVYGLGFPLDDAWIHQTYGRNLGMFGEWAFQPGKPSGGSSAPGWTFLLAIGYWLRVDFFIWTFFLGCATLFLTGLMGWKIIKIWLPGPKMQLLFGSFLVGEWHMVWAALSGMETLALCTMILAFFYLLTQQPQKGWLIGLAAGGACWLRPESVTLLLPAMLLIVLGHDPLRTKLSITAKLVVGFSILFIPYVLFNFSTSGALWPTTFYAKQAEYALHQQIPFLERLINSAGQAMIGAGILLVPGFLFACYKFIRERNLWGTAAASWWIMFVVMYASVLPVTYQHGRYMMPAMSVFWLVGWVGSYSMVRNLRIKSGLMRIARMVGKISFALIWIIFLGLGGGAYAQDVAIINSEMVDTAKWVNENTEKDALLAVHDIGAAGYFTNRKIIDLAGLESPEVIPFLRDEEKIYKYLIETGANYLITFPGWYPGLVESMKMVYQGNQIWSLQAGGENMAVYKIRIDLPK